MATESHKKQTWLRIIGFIAVMFGIKGAINGEIIAGLIVILGGASVLPVVNRYIIYVPVPVGGTLIALGILMGGGQP